MPRTIVIWTLGILGWLASYVMFFKWMAVNEWDFFGGWAEAFSISDFGLGFHLDLVAVTFMVVALALYDRAKLGALWTAAVIASLGLSVSIALAIYLAGIWRHERAVARS